MKEHVIYLQIPELSQHPWGSNGSETAVGHQGRVLKQ